MSTHMTTIFQSPRALMVKNLRPGLTECGKIKIGAKGRVVTSKGGKEFQPPQKLDHFLITTLERGQDGNFLRDQEIHARLGDKPTQIPIRLLFDDPWLSFQTVYTAFKGAIRFCTGDGETADRLQQDGTLKQRSCPCQLLDPAYQGPDKCKINGTLSVMIEGATVVGGVWKLRTTSINTCQGIAASLAFIMSVTGGKLAGIPLMLTVRPKAATTPTGVSTTVFVVGIEFRGSIEDLRDYAHQQALSDAKHGERMKMVEDHARKLLAAPIVNDNEEEDLRDEFYPGAAAEAHDAHLVEPDQPTAADRRAAMQEVELVEMADADGEVHLMQPGEVEQFVRDNPGAEVVAPDPAPKPAPPVANGGKTAKERSTEIAAALRAAPNTDALRKLYARLSGDVARLPDKARIRIAEIYDEVVAGFTAPATAAGGSHFDGPGMEDPEWQDAADRRNAEHAAATAQEDLGV